MFKIKTVVAALIFLLCTHASAATFNVKGGEDPWPWSITELWDNIQGIWQIEDQDNTEYFRFEIVNRYSNGNLIIRVERLSDLVNRRILSTDIGIGREQKKELRAVIDTASGRQYMLVQAYVRPDASQNGSDVVLGVTMRPVSREDDPSANSYFLLKKVADIE